LDPREHQEQFERLRKELDQARKDNYAKAMENPKRSIGLANLLIQVLIGAVALMIAFGVFSYVKTGRIRTEVLAQHKSLGG
jgi:hypothetical protein